MAYGKAKDDWKSPDWDPNSRLLWPRVYPLRALSSAYALSGRIVRDVVANNALRTSWALEGALRGVPTSGGITYHLMRATWHLGDSGKRAHLLGAGRCARPDVVRGRVGTAWVRPACLHAFCSCMCVSAPACACKGRRRCRAWMALSVLSLPHAWVKHSTHFDTPPE